MQKTCTHCENVDVKENDSLAFTMLKSLRATLIGVIIAWLITCILFAGYVVYDKYVDSQYDVIDYSYDLSTDGGGDANFIGNNGDING